MGSSSGLLAEKIWIDSPLPYGEELLTQVCDSLSISHHFGRILAHRDLLDEFGAKRFLNPHQDQLFDPLLMKDMERAAVRLYQAVMGYEKILVYGDFDVDGTTSTTMLYDYLKRLGARVHYFIPNRMKDGYGLSPAAVERIAQSGVELLVMVDSGSTALEEARLLAQAGVELIIADHHQFGGQIPQAYAIIDPHQPGCGYPFKELSAAGVVFKLLQTLDGLLAQKGLWEQRGLTPARAEQYLDLVALATVADMCPLVGENRVLVKLGIDQINHRPRQGVACLLRACNVHQGLSASLINHKVAPKINALGRVGEPAIGVRLLLAHSLSDGKRLARQVCEVNRTRQQFEREAMAGALAQAAEQSDHAALVLVGKNWHPGVVGILASRISNQEKKPVVCITLASPQQALGSARGFGAFSMLKGLGRCAKWLDRFGGHDMACGLALPPENVPAFTACFLEGVAGQIGSHVKAPSTLPVETWLQPGELNKAFVNEMSMLFPYGSGNPEPVVGVRAITLGQQPQLFHNRHLKFRLPIQGGADLEAFAWDPLNLPSDCSGQVDLALSPQVVQGGNGISTTFRVLDLRRS